MATMNHHSKIAVNREDDGNDNSDDEADNSQVEGEHEEEGSNDEGGQEEAEGNDEGDDDDNEDHAEDRISIHSPHHSQQQQQQQRQQQHAFDPLAADVAFLDAVSATDAAAVATAAAHSNTTSSAAAVALHRSALWRLQVDELIQECQLHVVVGQQYHPTAAVAAATGGGGGGNTKVPSWMALTMDYMQHIQSIVEQHDFMIALGVTQNNRIDNSINKDKTPSKHISTINSATTKPTTTVTTTAIRLAAVSQQPNQVMMGMTHPAGNAQVLPTFDMTFLIPTTAWADHDWRGGVYFEKRNAIVAQVARFLAAPERRAVVGSVYWQWEHADARKPCLLLIPPTVATELLSSKDTRKKSKKRKHLRIQEAATTLQWTKKLRFRVRLLFGMQNADWIPSVRLLPNRCNLLTTPVAATPSKKKSQPAQAKHAKGAAQQQLPTSQYYNHAFMEDAAHQWEGISNRGNNHSLADGNDYPQWNAAVLLAKIWCLQRGLLRGHDSLQIESIAMLMLYLFRTKQTNGRMTPLQVFTAWLKLLVETDWLGEASGNISVSEANQKNKTTSLIRKAPGEVYQDLDVGTRVGNARAVLVLPLLGKTVDQTVAVAPMATLYARLTRESPLTPQDPPTLLALYRQQYRLGPILLDPTMSYNYLGRLSPAYTRLLQADAARSLASVTCDANVVARPLTTLFMTESRFWKRFDAYLQVPLDQVQFKSGRSVWWGSDRADVGNYESVARGLLHVLRLALGNRIHQIHALSTGNGSLVDIPASTDGVNDSDEVPTIRVGGNKQHLLDAFTVSPPLQSPTGKRYAVLGFLFNPDTCHRQVDRGPQADDEGAVRTFVDFWGSKAELRQFDDGSLVYSVLFRPGPPTAIGKDKHMYLTFQNDDIMHGGVVERIIRYILQRHFFDPAAFTSHKPWQQFPHRNMMSAIEVAALQPQQQNTSSMSPPDSSKLFDAFAAHHRIINAFQSLSDFLQKNSMPTLRVPGTNESKAHLGIPLVIDSVEAMSPALRYATLFPPIPNRRLGGAHTVLVSKSGKRPGAIVSDPIDIQICFGPSSKWPTDIRAIGAAKSAMLIQMLNGIDSMKQRSLVGADDFKGPTTITPEYAQLGYRGYVFRIYVRADPELRLLRGLINPSPEAASLFRYITRKHIKAVMHHNLIHSVLTRYPSASAALRLALRWVSSHLLSGHISHEAVELLMTHVYTDPWSALGAPGSAIAGFMRWLDLVALHDWNGEPLVVDPHGELSEDDYANITKQFDSLRSQPNHPGPPMFLVAPYDATKTDSLMSTMRIVQTERHNHKRGEDCEWMPSQTLSTPEAVVLTRLVALASRSISYLSKTLTSCDPEAWSSVFRESSTAFRSYSVLFRVLPDYIVDPESSSTGHGLDQMVNENKQTTTTTTILETSYTRSMQTRFEGPKVLLRRANDAYPIHLECSVVKGMVDQLRKSFHNVALFFYNEYCPNVIAILWRPCSISSRPFSALTSKCACPITTDDHDDGMWKPDTLVTMNFGDILREMAYYTNHVIGEARILDLGPSAKFLHKRLRSNEQEKDESCVNNKSTYSDQCTSDSDNESKSL